jgi:hypothetical protein
MGKGKKQRNKKMDTKRSCSDIGNFEGFEFWDGLGEDEVVFKLRSPTEESAAWVQVVGGNDG